MKTTIASLAAVVLRPAKFAFTLAAPPVRGIARLLKRTRGGARKALPRHAAARPTTTAAADWDTQPPSLSHYQLQERIGAGGMGTVYRAVDRRSGTTVAIKILHTHLKSSPVYLERFLREARIASLLDSPYMVRILDSGSDRGHHFIATEFVPGVTLGDMLRTGRLEVVQALAIAAQAAGALEEAARRGVVHRDIKPDNMIFTQAGNIKVADFGISRLADATTVTVTGMFVGTMAYTAPEQAVGRADMRSDIYSLGITIFEMLTGDVPFHADTPSGMIRMHEEQLPPLEDLRDVPEPVVALVKRCLEKDPAARFQHPSDLLGAIEGARRAIAPALPEAWMAAVVSTLLSTRISALERTVAASEALTEALEADAAAGGQPHRRLSPAAFGWWRGEHRVPILLTALAVLTVVAGIGIGSVLALSGGSSDGPDEKAAVRGESATPTPARTPSSTSASAAATPGPESSAQANPGGGGATGGGTTASGGGATSRPGGGATAGSGGTTTGGGGTAGGGAGGGSTPTNGGGGASTPTPQATTTKCAAPGQLTQGIAWDGANLWLADNSSTIFKVNTTCQTLGAYSAPQPTPEGLAWDGATFWLFTTNQSDIYQFIPGQSPPISSFRSPNQTIGGTNDGLAWDGGALWYSDRYNVYRLSTAGTVLSSFAFGQEIAGLAWDGQNLWLAYNYFPDNAALVKVDTQGNILSSFTTSVFHIDNIAWGNGHLWVAGTDSLAGQSMIYSINI